MVDLSNGRGWLNPGPAASIHRIDREIGHPLQITEAGRSWAQQKAHWDTYQRQGHPIALHPDTPSVHQVGAAIDSDEAQKHLALMTEHGWVRTVWRNGRLVEPWHFEYQAHRDQHANESAHGGNSIPTREEEGDDMGYYFYDATNPNRPYRWFSEGRGKSRPLTSAEWDARKAIASTTGGVKYELVPVSNVWYDRIVALGTY